MASYQELVAQKESLARQQAELEKQIADALQAERSAVLQQIKSLMAEHGITVADLSGKSFKVGTGKSSANAGRKVAPKFRNPATGETWTGRGLQPKWLKAALEGGRKLEEFALPG